MDKSKHNKIQSIESRPHLLDRVIEMAWEDRTPFEAIKAQFNLSEPEVIDLMRRNLKPSSFRLWRKRVSGRSTKHQALRGFRVGTHKCDRQRHITGNKYRK
ncbi:TIGR03643 family protein [Schleiferia thermophila]|uniref:Uncharacterized protein (TIGR03643 family) n=1 Tax=Schleiferia thermophila TaxID=884107 RepID=A0A369A6M8_9FLAO|nr:TIGR03643 family protein [Schleiferia thermophila]RCX04929.1 uncharacterized protein (TIGR03643 family) [Schleiferia thermophila]